MLSASHYSEEATGLQQERMEAQLAREMMADLGSYRRERILTTDFKENIAAFVPSSEIQATRLVNISGTEENKKARSAAKQLKGWNSAYQSLKDDGTTEEALRDVNEGLGQTHRARLQADDTVKEWTGEESYYRGSHGGRWGRGGRGGHGGGRGGGFAGQGGGRQTSRGHTSVKRQRTVKGHSVNRELTSPMPMTTTKESPDLQAAREFQASLGGASKKNKEHAKGLQVSVDSCSKPSLVLTDDRRAPSTRVSRQGPLPKVELASPDVWMAIARVRANVPRTAEQPAQRHTAASAHFAQCTVAPPVTTPVTDIKISLPPGTKQLTSGKVTVSSPTKKKASVPTGTNQSTSAKLPADSPKANVQRTPDSSCSHPPEQPSARVLDPLNHLRALEASGFLNKELAAVVNKAISTAQAATESTTGPNFKATLRKDATVTNEPPRPVKYTEAELKALQPSIASTADIRPKVAFTIPKKNGTAPEAKKLVNPFASPIISAQPASPGKVPRGFAQRLADQRKALIGEQVHRTRFLPPVHTLIEGFRKLSVYDYTNTEPDTDITDTKSSKATKHKENLFGFPKSKSSGTELPPHLRNFAPVTDHGAAARAQYGIILPDFTVPTSKLQSHETSTPKAVETFPQTLRSSEAAINPFVAARAPVNTKPGPSLPAHLRGQTTAADPGAAARAQYGNVPTPTTNSLKPSSTVSKQYASTKRTPSLPARLLGHSTVDSGAAARAEYGIVQAPANTRKPSLPAHLRGQTAVADAGAAARSQYGGNILAPVTNTQKPQPSSPTPNENPLTPTKHRRGGSKVNTSGFIGLAQAARGAMKEEDDPIKIASSKGF